MTEEVKMTFRIKGILDSEHFPGHVEVFMDPKNKDLFKMNDMGQDPGITLKGGPGMMFPAGNPEQAFQMFFKQLPNAMKQKFDEDHDPRRFIWIEGSADFQTRGWKHGDEIEITLKKNRK